MVSLLSGLALLVTAVLLIRVAKPQPDGTPVAFLSRDSLATLYALFFTACIGMGIALTVNGILAVATAGIPQNQGAQQ
jgi:hypothetical protein